MIRFGWNTDPMCSLCSIEEESVEHLFQNCPYSSLIYNSCPVPLKCNWSAYLNGEFMLHAVPKTKQQLAYLFISIAVHSIRLERNARIHGSPARGSFNLLLDIKRKIREKLFTCNSFKTAIRNDAILVTALY